MNRSKMVFIFFIVAFAVMTLALRHAVNPPPSVSPRGTVEKLMEKNVAAAGKKVADANTKAEYSGATLNAAEEKTKRKKAAFLKLGGEMSTPSSAGAVEGLSTVSSAPLPEGGGAEAPNASSGGLSAERDIAGQGAAPSAPSGCINSSASEYISALENETAICKRHVADQDAAIMARREEDKWKDVAAAKKTDDATALSAENKDLKNQNFWLRVLVGGILAAAALHFLLPVHMALVVAGG